MNTKLTFLKVIFLSALVFSLNSTANAAGDSDKKEEVKEEQCPKGATWDKEAKTCVCDDKSLVWSDKTKQCVAKSAEILTDEDLYKKAVALINSKDYETALDILWRIKDQNQPKVLNYIGFSNRKLGKIEEGIGYYNKALAINADFHQARQYLGEGYLQKGDVAGARQQLSELGKRCGKDCDYYKDLSQQITAFEAKKA